MKGKIELRFLAPNTGRVRTRLEKVSPDFTKNLRAALQQAAAETIEANQVQFRAAVIEKVAKMEEAGEIAFAGTHKDSVFNVTNDFFTIFCESTKEAFEERFPVDRPEDKEEDDEVATPAQGEAETLEAPAKSAEILDEFED